MRRVYILGYVSLCLIWGTTWLAVHLVVRDLPPFLAAAVRFFAAAILLFIWVMIRKPVWPRSGREWNAIFVLGFTVIAIPYALQFWAQQFVTSSLTAVLFSGTPITVALLTPLMTHHKVPRQAVQAMLVAFGALLLLLYADLRFGTRAFWGGIAVLFSMFGSAWSAVYAKLRLRGVDPVASTAVQLLVGAIGLLWATWALESHRQAVWTKTAILGLLFLAVFGSAIAFAIYYWLLQHMQPYQVSTMNMVIPVVAVLEGSLLAHDPIPPMMIVAMIVVLASVAVVLRAEAETEAVAVAPNLTAGQSESTTETQRHGVTKDN
jgi:drug/metabolite transporter (DMT)-like permease